MAATQYTCKWNNLSIKTLESPCPVFTISGNKPPHNHKGEGCFGCRYLVFGVKEKHQELLESEKEKPLTYAEFLKTNPDFLEID